MKYSAEDFSRAGDKYLDTPYSTMDCQRFVEKCMADVGFRRDLPGSNAWYRAMDWVGTPEECKHYFGSVPTGALLFILEQDGKEPAKYRHDGIGNASHIGIVTHRDAGAIHSSASRGCVAWSKFSDKSISGGWNRIGLLKCFDYGKVINWTLDHSGAAPADQNEREGKPMQGIVTAQSGSTVNLRKSPSLSAALVERVPIGADIDIIELGDTWSKVEANGKTGYMMTEFIQLDGEVVPGEDEQLPAVEPDPDGAVQLRVSYESLAAAYPFLKAICDQIVELVGRG